MDIAILFALSLVALLFVLVPYTRMTAKPKQSSPDVDVYKSQLNELESDIERGLISAEEAKPTRVEIERRLLKAAGQQEMQIDVESRNNFVITSLVLVILLSVGLYMILGTPGMPDFPKNADQQVTDNAEQAEAIERSKEMIAKVKDRLAVAPDEVEGWAALGRLEMNLGNFQASAEALDKARTLAPDNFDYTLMYAESLIAASGQRVTPAAKVILNKAIKMNPGHSGPQFYLGLADYQEGEIELAVTAWKSAREELEEGHPMAPLIDAWVNRAEVELGRAEPQPQANAPSISREQAEAIQNMSDDEQQQLIRQMVAQLAERQQQNPSNIEGWVRLSRSYMVLGRKEDAIAAMQSAVDNAPDDQKEALQKEVEKLTNMQ